MFDLALSVLSFFAVIVFSLVGAKILALPLTIVCRPIGHLIALILWPILTLCVFLH